MISRMAKPEEVLVVENEQGEVVREFMKDTDAINMYKSMRETLGEATHTAMQTLAHIQRHTHTHRLTYYMILCMYFLTVLTVWLMLCSIPDALGLCRHGAHHD